MRQNNSRFESGGTWGGDREIYIVGGRSIQPLDVRDVTGAKVH